MQWLLTSYSEADPFYIMTQETPEQLIHLRKQTTQILMESTRNLTPDFFKFAKHKNRLTFL